MLTVIFMLNSVRRGRPPKFDRPTVLHAAAECFGRHGYEGTSIPELTSAMKISAQSLYAAFGTKAQLFEEASSWYLENVGKYVSLALSEEKDYVHGLMRSLIESAHFFTKASSRTGCLICNSAIVIGEENHGIALHASKLRNKRIDEFKAHITRAVEQGFVRLDADVSSVARLVMGVQQAMSAQASDGASLEELLSTARLIEPVLEGIRKS